MNYPIPPVGVRPQITALCIALGVILSAAIVVGSPSQAAACSCMPSPPAAQALERADAVVFGQVSALQRSEWRLAIEFDVIRRWKGPDVDRMELHTAFQGAACGFSFQEGETYLVYATEHQGDLTVSLCSRSRATDEAGAINELQASQHNWTATVDPLTTALGYVHVQLERRLSSKLTIYAGPHLRLFDSLLSSDTEPYRGYGAEFGLRFFPRSDALDGLWISLRSVGAYLTTHQPADPATSFGGYTSALIGYTHLVSNRLVLSGGAGIQYLYYEVDGLGPNTLFPALHTTLGWAF